MNQATGRARDEIECIDKQINDLFMQEMDFCKDISDLDSIDSQIAKLQQDKAFILQRYASALPPKKDSSYYYKSKYVNANCDTDIHGFFGSVFVGAYYMTSSFSKAYRIYRALHYPVGSELRTMHKLLGRITDEHLRHPSLFIKRFVGRGLLLGPGIPLLFATSLGVIYQKW
jgi:hypothetical protein